MKFTHDLVVLCADKDADSAMREVLARHQALGIKRIGATTDFEVHPERDPGCATNPTALLAPFIATHRHALVLFDHEGSGRERDSREELEESVELKLAKAGWGGRSAAIVIAPELEAWLWSDSPHVDDAVKWDEGRFSKLRTWLVAEKLVAPGQMKPERPKETLKKVRETARAPKSSTLFADVARKVSVEGCVDPSFAKLKRVLRDWFPPGKGKTP